MIRGSRIRRVLTKSNMLVSFYYGVMRQFHKVLFALSPTVLVKYRFLRIRGRFPNLSNPHTFDEKLSWLMLFWRHPLKARCADKFSVRSYVEEHGLGHMLPQVLGVYEKSDEIDFACLPDRFILKCAHGC